MKILTYNICSYTIIANNITHASMIIKYILKIRYTIIYERKKICHGNK